MSAPDVVAVFDALIEGSGMTIGELMLTRDAAAELQRKARCWDALQHARTVADADPEDAEWKRLAREGSVVPATKACRASLGIGLLEARACVNGYMARVGGAK